jgi:hypothetical protein
VSRICEASSNGLHSLFVKRKARKRGEILRRRGEPEQQEVKGSPPQQTRNDPLRPTSNDSLLKRKCNCNEPMIPLACAIDRKKRYNKIKRAPLAIAHNHTMTPDTQRRRAAERRNWGYFRERIQNPSNTCNKARST